MFDIVLGREGTPLANRVLSVSWDRLCRISNLQTGEEVKSIRFDSQCWVIGVDKTQTMIAVGSSAQSLTFVETLNFTKVKEVALDSYITSLAFNKRNDCMLAITSNGKVYSFKF